MGTSPSYITDLSPDYMGNKQDFLALVKALDL